MNKNYKIKIIIVFIFSIIALPLIIHLINDIKTVNQIEQNKQTIPITNAQAKQSNKINKPTEIKINLPENKKFIGLSTDPKHYLDSDNGYNELMIITKDITNNDYYVYRYEHDGTPINIDYELPIIIHENINN